MSLLALAGELDVRDENDNPTGELGTFEDVAWHIRATEEELRDAVDALAERHMVDERDGILFVTNFTQRQSRAPSASRSRVRERVRRHRNENVTSTKRARNENVTSTKRRVTPSDTDTEADTEGDTDTDTEEEARRVRVLVSSLSNAGLFPSSDLALSTWMDAFEDADYDLDFFTQALKEAVRHNVKTPAYVRGIIRRCKQQNRKPGDRASPTRKGALAGVDEAIRAFQEEL